MGTGGSNLGCHLNKRDVHAVPFLGGHACSACAGRLATSGPAASRVAGVGSLDRMCTSLLVTTVLPARLVSNDSVRDAMCRESQFLLIATFISLGHLAAC